MGIPSRPLKLDFEGTSCYVSGKQCAHLYCTSSAYAMHISRSSLNVKRPTGCQVRQATGDAVGGSTIPQQEPVARSKWGIASEVRVGSNVASPIYVASRMLQGRSVVLQGNTEALLKTAFRTTRGPVNHCLLVNEGKGWHDDGHGHQIPAYVLVYDPEANGRAASWGRVPQGPQWWPWAVALAFAAALRPWGDGDPRTLGPGKWYCAIGPDTEPHVHLHYTGSVKTSPFPRNMTVKSPAAGRKVNARKGPSTSYAIVKTLADGSTFAAYQQTPKGQVLDGSGLWYGDHNGTLWVHSSGVK